ncbi:conserved hypothetical protein [Candidatus Sulfopaludibacter sp. SbA4]|nr:conserved hypothetical protein [Candidatus Sulfopaludibacter sp. SbA4]
MNEHDFEDTQRPIEPPAGGVKAPYRKPAFRYERIFETRALTCGKIGSTQKSCTTNRYNS